MLALRRAFRIEPDERRPALLLSVYYFLMTAGYVVGIAAIPSLFMARVPGSEDLYPLLMTANAVVTAGLVAVFGRLVQRVALNALAVGSTVTFAVLFMLLEVLLQLTDWASAMMFVLLIAQFNVAAFQYYLIAGTIFDARQSKRILGLAGIGGSVAGIVSGLLLPPFIAALSGVGERTFDGYTSLGTEAVVILMALLMLATAGIIRQLRPHMVLTNDAADDTDNEDEPRTRLRDPYLLSLMALIASFIFVATTIDAQFQAVGIAAFAGDADAFTSFKGVYTAVVGALQMLMRLFVVSPVLVNFGMLAGLMALPTVIVAATTSFLAAPGLTAATLMKGGDQVTRFTINETSTELTWAPIPPEDRVRLKPFVSGTFVAVVQGITGIVVFGANRLDMNLSAIVLGVCVIWVPVVIYLQRGYVRKLLESIRERRFDFQDLNVDTADSATVQTIDQVLRSGTDAERAFMLDVIEAVQATPWMGALTVAYECSDNTIVRGKILDLAGKYPQILPEAELMRLITDANELMDEAMIAAAERGLVGVIPRLREQLHAERHELRAAAGRALIILNQAHVDEARQTLQALLNADDTAANVQALEAINRMTPRRVSSVVTTELLRTLLRRPAAVRLRALDTIALIKAPLLAEIVDLLGGEVLAWRVRQTLRQFPKTEVRAVLLQRYQDESTPLETRIGISRALEDYLDEAVLAALLQTLNRDNYKLYSETVDRLLVYSRQIGLPAQIEKQLEAETLALAGLVYEITLALFAVDESEEPLLVEMLQLDLDELKPKLLKLAVLDRPDVDIDSVIYRLQQADEQHGNVLEVLDNVLSSAERGVIVPLFENADPDMLLQMARRYYPNIDQPLTKELVTYANSEDDWQSAVALDYVLRHPEANVHISRIPISDETYRMIVKPGMAGAAVTLMAAGQEREETNLLSTLEKTVLLKNSILFENVTARDLYYIAQICEDVQLKADEILFQAGTPGDTMYIVARGEVRIYQGETTIATSKTGAPIGEIALLDQKPRTASAQAMTETNLLAIGSDAFFSTVTAHVNINRAIMRVLASRVRDLIETEQPVTED